MPDIGFLNGCFSPLEEVKVSVEDRGFQFGDGIYELIRVYDGVPFHVSDHLARLARSAREIRLALPYTPVEWEERIREGLRQSGYREAKVYIQVTRGVAPREHRFADELSPTVVMTFRALMEGDTENLQHGVAAITVPDIRWERCDIKSLNLLPNVLAKQQAADLGAFEAIFVKDNQVMEGTSSNVMVVHNRKVSTPALSTRILPGVTRNVVIELARKNGILVQERSVSMPEMVEAEEILLVGTTIEVLPVTRLNGRPVGAGIPGDIAKEFRRLFHQHVASCCSSFI